MKHLSIVAIAIVCTCAAQATADTADARCDIYAAGEDHADVMIPCTFSQRQGYITINRSDSVAHELTPVGDTPGNFTDQHGHAVYRQSGLADQGLIFRFPNESIYVYWDTAALRPENSDNPTHPFSTDDYDATTLLACRAANTAAFGTCPAGILRMDNRQASIVVLSPTGEQFTINFLTDVVNASNRAVEASLVDDTWTVTIDQGDVYQVPVAAIEGG